MSKKIKTEEPLIETNTLEARQAVEQSSADDIVSDTTAPLLPPGQQTDLAGAWQRDYVIEPNPQPAIAPLSWLTRDVTAGVVIAYNDQSSTIVTPAAILSVFNHIPGQTTITQGKTFYDFSISRSIERLKHEVFPGDTISARITAYLSMTGTEPSFISLDIDRLICKNGAVRKESKELHPRDLINITDPGVITRALDSHFETSLIKIETLREKKFAPSFLEADITERAEKMGIPKKFCDEAHLIIHKENELLTQDRLISGWIIYNGFNNALFKRTDSSLTFKRKISIDQELFKYLSESIPN